MEHVVKFNQQQRRVMSGIGMYPNTVINQILTERQQQPDVGNGQSQGCTGDTSGPESLSFGRGRIPKNLGAGGEGRHDYLSAYTSCNTGYSVAGGAFGARTQARGQHQIDQKDSLSPQSPQEGLILGWAGTNGHHRRPTARDGNNWFGGDEQGHETSPTPKGNQISVPKTPVALLHEMSSKGFTPPVFDIREDGPPDKRIFEVTVKTACILTKQCYEGHGLGKTKKDAKHHAAKNILLDIDSRLEQLMICPPPPPLVLTVTDSTEKGNIHSATASSLVKVPVDVDPEVDPDNNSVRDLNELCMRLKIPAPDYEEIQPSDSGIFAFKCSMDVALSETGSGRTKKMAKRVAANKILQKFLSVLRSPVRANEILPLPEQDDIRRKLVQFVEIPARKPPGKTEFLELLGVHIPPGSGEKSSAIPALPQPLASAEKIFQIIKSWTGEKLDQLMSLSPTEFSKSSSLMFTLFTDITSEQKLKVEFLDFPTTPSSRRQDRKHFRSHLTISSLPSSEEKWMISFPGCGNSVENAHRAAAYEFLSFVKDTLVCAAQQ